MFQHTCFNCKFFLCLTNHEKEYIFSLLSKHGSIQQPIGCCTYRNRVNPTLVRRYLWRPVSECYFWSEGRFGEPLDIKCPTCREGELLLRRIPYQDQTKIIIGCSNYPKCRYSASSMKTNFLCRTCDTSLTMTVDQYIIYCCEQCNIRSKLPISIHSKPNVAKITQNCPHDQIKDTCKTCSQSISLNKSLIEIETPVVAAQWRYIRHEPDLAWDFKKEKQIIRAQPRLQEEFSDDFDEDETMDRNKPIDDVLGRVVKVYLEQKHNTNNRINIIYFKFAGLRPRDKNADYADYDYSEEDVRAALFAEEIDIATTINNMSSGQYIEQVCEDSKVYNTDEIYQKFRLYSRGKVVLKYFELAFSNQIKEVDRDYESDDYANYSDDGNDTSSYDADEKYEAYSEIDEAYEEYIQERTEAMDEYVRSQDTGWHEE